MIYHRYNQTDDDDNDNHTFDHFVFIKRPKTQKLPVNILNSIVRAIENCVFVTHVIRLSRCFR